MTKSTKENVQYDLKEGYALYCILQMARLTRGGKRMNAHRRRRFNHFNRESDKFFKRTPYVKY